MQRVFQRGSLNFYMLANHMSWTLIVYVLRVTLVVKSSDHNVPVVQLNKHTVNCFRYRTYHAIFGDWMGHSLLTYS